ncbi:cytochrome b/b6 domain-containing protein [Ectothiorhodospira mobilis]|uniref:cytochrome b/b6 domain-containing protein n=1 Tax=Ectothiorhodospira mobilis TaxID=195064 RepID=UPI0019036660|nr:cytochrome b/b6 domain-containing protein [Ectothiorhodospira mobilis]MBK1690866.1 hydrogenase [Ectothiorhodospira mobilis]
MTEKRQTQEAIPLHPLRLWDAPTRLFHWALPVLLAALWYTGQDLTTLGWHMQLGYALLTLVLFRIAWGFFGSRSARFPAFVTGPGTVARYVGDLARGRMHRSFGHNPLGGWSVLLMLGLLLVQAVTGLFADDEIFTQGPLATLVSGDTRAWLTGIHHANFNLILAVVTVHVVAVVLHRVLKGDDLVRPMITGRKPMPADRGVEEVHFVGMGRALVLLALCAALVWGGISLAP